jgi:Holliday junction resolvase RusA-like endonuclease
MDERPVIRIEIPGEPKGVGRVKARAVTNKAGRTFATVYTPGKTRTEAGVIRMYAEKAMDGRVPLTGSIEIRFSMFVSIPKSMSKTKRALALATPPMLRPKIKPDVDNAAKFWDQLNKVVWVDDSQISDCHIWKRYSDRPRVVIEVREVCE